jgi:hypothetical protein
MFFHYTDEDGLKRYIEASPAGIFRANLTNAQMQEIITQIDSKKWSVFPTEGWEVSHAFPKTQLETLLDTLIEKLRLMNLKGASDANTSFN